MPLKSHVELQVCEYKSLDKCLTKCKIHFKRGRKYLIEVTPTSSYYTSPTAAVGM